MAAFYVPATAVFSFVGLLGQAWGLVDSEVASALSVCLLAGFAGSLTAGALGKRVRARLAMGRRAIQTPISVF